MPIRVRCDQCEKSVRVPDEYAGVVMSCPGGCGGMLKVPTVEDAKASGTYTAAATAGSKPAPASKPASASKPAAAETKPAPPKPAVPTSPVSSKPPAAPVKPTSPQPTAPKPIVAEKPAKSAPATPAKPAAVPSKSVAPSSKTPAAEKPADKPAPMRFTPPAAPPPPPPKTPAAKAPSSVSADLFADLPGNDDVAGLSVDLSGLDDLSPAGELSGGLGSLLEDETGSSTDLGKAELGADESLPEISDEIETTTKPASSSKLPAIATDAKASVTTDKPTPVKTPKPPRPRGSGGGVPAIAIDAGLALLALAACVGVYFAVAPPAYVRPAIAVVRGSGQGGAATIRIEGDNKILVQGRPVASPEDVAAELRASSAQQVMIEASGDALYDTVERVVAAAGRGGVTQVQLATTEP